MIRKPKRAKKRKNPNTSDSGASNLINTIITPKNNGVYEIGAFVGGKKLPLKEVSNGDYNAA